MSDCGDGSATGVCPHTLGYHSDVSPAVPEDQDLLCYNATVGMWVPCSFEELEVYLNDLDDVTITSANDCDFLKYDAGSGQWVNISDDDAANIFSSLTTLGELSDVTVPSPADGEFLRFDSGSNEWVNGTASLNDLDDVNGATAPSACEVLRDDGANNWTAGTLDLDCMSDVNITSPAADEVLKYNGSSWVNATLDCTDIVNASSVPGANVCDALNNLDTGIAGNDSDITSLDGRVTALENAGGGMSGVYSECGSVLYEDEQTGSPAIPPGPFVLGTFTMDLDSTYFFELETVAFNDSGAGNGSVVSKATCAFRRDGSVTTVRPLTEDHNDVQGTPVTMTPTAVASGADSVAFRWQQTNMNNRCRVAMCIKYVKVTD